MDEVQQAGARTKADWPAGALMTPA